jgi:hypothetical protein
MPEPRFNGRAHRIVGIIGWVFLVVGLSASESPRIC